MSWQLTQCRDWAQLEKQFDFVCMQYVPQDRLHHAEGNVAIHTQMVLRLWKIYLNINSFQNLNNKSFGRQRCCMMLKKYFDKRR